MDSIAFVAKQSVNFVSRISSKNVTNVIVGQVIARITVNTLKGMMEETKKDVDVAARQWELASRHF